MKVIDYSPCEWYLLSWGDKFILDVNCSYSFVGTGVTLELTPSETESYLKNGKSFIVELAWRVNASSSQMGTKIFERRISPEVDNLVSEAIGKFNKEKNN